MEKPEPTLDQILETMMSYGGHFVQHLARTIRVADHINRPKLLNAFPEVIETYKDFFLRIENNKN